MANVTYQSTVLIAAPNLAIKKKAAYNALGILINHIEAGTGGYTMDLISADVGVTTAQRITIILSGPLPGQAQIDRYGLVLV